MERYDKIYCSGYSTNLEYTPHDDCQKKKEQRKRKRNIIWFNPPYSKNVQTNIGKAFFKLLDKNFPKSNKLHKIFNRNTIKISYSCMKNIKSIISGHINTALKSTKDDSHLCNFRNRNNCPLKGKCLTPRIKYQATVKSEGNMKRYIGLSETTFKERYRNHIKDFNKIRYRNNTELTKNVWQLKESNKHFEIKWKILKRTNGTQHNGKCNLCLYEKLFIIDSIYDESLINKRSELINKCRHQNKPLLRTLKHT